MRLNSLLETVIVVSFTALFSCSNSSDDNNKDAESNQEAEAALGSIFPDVTEVLCGPVTK